MDVKTITVPNRDEQGWLQGTKTVTVEWKCPICGEKMKDPSVHKFSEDGEWHAIHVWDNDCGHIAKYTDLKEI